MQDGLDVCRFDHVKRQISVGINGGKESEPELFSSFLRGCFLHFYGLQTPSNGNKS